MRWLITGGCGFIGTNLIRYLATTGEHSVRVIDDLSVGRREDLAKVVDIWDLDGSKSFHGSSRPKPSTGQAEFLIGDIKDSQFALDVCRDMDVIVHLAANTGVAPSVEDPSFDCHNNVLGTLSYLEAARHNDVPRFVFASSGAPVGEVEPPIHEEIAPHPVSPYGASKLAGEGYCSAYWGTYHLETVALRFGNVYGPGSLHKNSAVAKFAKDAILAGEMEIYGDGGQTRDFIYVEDLVAAIYLAATARSVGGELFQIAANSEVTVSEIAERVRKSLERYNVTDVAVRHGNPRVGDVMRTYSDTRKAQYRLGWRPSYTLDQGINRTIDYFIECHKAGVLRK